MRTSDLAEKEAATRRKEERKTQAQFNKEEAHSHNEDARQIAESAGAATAAATTDTETPVLTGSTGDYATIPTGPATADRVHPRGHVRADAPSFT
ncbi:hypothetical protein Pint_36441 [Pistacia integerrima]|uniref:Uncharacterized protein n=1 Tax=Pistacia integerrima TaxID=434235 RepID=A0ACC0Y5D8_9ROSI|nr:hypothetical protein Pint_36441 [Pistacia integerrima]